VDVKAFTDDFNAQAKSQTTVVSALWCEPKWEYLPLGPTFIGECHYGSQRQHPRHPGSRRTNRHKDFMLHLLHS
jgi:hypothetical protein